jgi:hypothetical protein
MSVRLDANAVVEKHFRYWSGSDASIDEQATVLGRIVRKEMPESLAAWSVGGVLAALWLSLALINFTSTLVLGLLLIHVSPAHAERIGSTLVQRPGGLIRMGSRSLRDDTDLGGPSHDDRGRYSTRFVAAGLVLDESLCRTHLCNGMDRATAGGVV